MNARLTDALANVDMAHFGLGDPFTLDCNRDYLQRLDKQFSAQQQNNGMAPIIASFRQHYFFSTEDQRVVRVYNMAAFSAFVGASVTILRGLHREMNMREYAARSGLRPLIKAATACLKRPQFQNALRTIGQLIGSITDDQTITAIMGALSSQFVDPPPQSQTHAARNARWQNVLILSTMLDLWPWLSTHTELQRQKLQNASLLLSSVWSFMADNHDAIIDSNVLIAALDERQFCSFNIFSPLSRDDGIWFQFRNMNLPGAPTCLEYDPTLCAKLAEFTELFHA